LLFFNGRGNFSSVNALPTDTFYESRYFAFFRSQWSEIPPFHSLDRSSTAAYLALKGGDNTWTHNHLDQGSFCFEIGGRRWAWDLGLGNYSLPGYFGPQRWDYYSTNTSGHNVLEFDQENQVLTAVSRIVAFNASADTRGSRFAVVDTSEAYAQWTSSVQRGFVLLWPFAANSQLLIVDEINDATATTIKWLMHSYYPPSKLSDTTCSIDGGGVTLNLVVIASQCPGAALTVELINIAPPQTLVERTYCITVQAPAASCARLMVAMGTAAFSQLGDYEVYPISQWGEQFPIV
jgi:hypothetical protein